MRWLVLGFLALIGVSAGAVEAAEVEAASFISVYSFDQPCAGQCSFAVYGGGFVDTNMSAVFALKGFTPIWDWEWADSGIVAGAASRRLVNIGGVIDLEGEIGAAKRFGVTTSPEAWGALYLRWTQFPWNNVVRTTIALSTGLSYAFQLDEYEIGRSGNGEGSKLLHFLSPEITFALPDRPDWELMFRFHHRSGGRDFILGPTKIFNNVDGGAQYGTVGVRHRF